MLQIQDRYPKARWRRRVPAVIDLSDPRAESPMETRSRLVLVLRGLPRPELQYQVFDEFGGFIARLDMAYPQLKLAMEYDGRGHIAPWQQESDARRLNLLDASGWSVLRFTAPDVLRTPTPWRPRSATPSSADPAAPCRELDVTDIPSGLGSG
ncbi:MAG: endonuclease domain-containing protein, partial [Pseudonocardiaceae bacterium]